jgi:hypothetical protein
MRRLLLALACLVWPVAAAAQTVPVVPGAVGFGMSTRAAYACGTNPTVYRVNSLADTSTTSGPAGDGTFTATFRGALEASGPRVVIFETSGTITVGNPGIRIQNPCITIAGQTAPSPGIEIINQGLEINTHDVLIQHIRIRPGYNASVLNCNDALDLYDRGGTANPHDVVIDHVSVSWGLDENFLVLNRVGPSNVTFWRSITAENLDATPGSASCTGTPEHGHGLLVYDTSTNVSIIQSVFANNEQRNPYAENGTTGQALNNVIYNWSNEWGLFYSSVASLTGGPYFWTAIGNRLIVGPMTIQGGSASRMYFDDDKNLTTNKVYDLDNTVTNDPLNQVQSKRLQPNGYDPTAGVSAPVSQAPIPAGYTPLSSTTMEATVLANAGARPADRDSVDTRIINEIKTRTNTFGYTFFLQFATQTSVGGYPSVATNTRALTLPASPHVLQPSHYTALEEWLHGYANVVEGTTTATGPFTYYVSSSTGSDSNTATQAQAISGTSTPTPWATIQHCHDNTAPGDSCVMRAGTYAGFSVSRSGSSGLPITYKAFPGETVNLTAAAGTVPGTEVATDLINLSLASYIVIDGLHQDGGSIAYKAIEGVSSSFITIQNSEWQGALQSGASFSSSAHDITVGPGNLIHDNVELNEPRGTVSTYGSGLVIRDASFNITIKGNAIYRNDGYGVAVSGHAHDVVLDGNLISDNFADNVLVSSAQLVTAKNNVIVNTAASISDGTCIANCGLQDAVGIGLTADTTGAYSGADANLSDETIIDNVFINVGAPISRVANTGASTPDSNWRIANNTFVLSVAGVSLGTGASSVATLALQNNVFTGTLGASQTFLTMAIVPSSSTVGNNDYHVTSGTASWTWGGTTTSTFATYTAAAGEINAITSDPLLVNEAANPGTLWGGGAVPMATILGTVDVNFTLQSGSPARDTGAFVVQVPTDRVGVTRPAGTFFDMGAYELVVAPTVTWVRKASTAAHSSLINTHPMTLTLAGPVAVADRIIVALVPTRSASTAPVITSVADNCGNTYHADIAQAFADGTFRGTVALYSASATSIATCTISVVWTGDGGFAMGGVAYAGLSTALNPVDVSASNHDDTGTSTAPASGNTPVTTAANQLLIGAFGDDGYARTYTPGGSAALITGTDNVDANADLAMTEKNATSSGAVQSAAGTLSAAAPWGQVAVVYKLAGTGATKTCNAGGLLRGAGCDEELR